MTNKPAASRKKRRIWRPRNPFAKILREREFQPRRREDKRRKILDRWMKDKE